MKWQWTPPAEKHRLPNRVYVKKHQTSVPADITDEGGRALPNPFEVSDGVMPAYRCNGDHSITITDKGGRISQIVGPLHPTQATP